MKRLVILAMVLSAVTWIACNSDGANDTLSDLTRTDLDYEYTIADQNVTAQGFCAPALSVEQILRDNDVYGEYGDRIESIEIAKIEYRVPENATAAAGRINLYVGEVAEFDLNDVERVAETQEILAETPVIDYERVNWIGSGRDTMSGYMAGYEDDGGLPFFLCGLFAATDDADDAVAVDMTMDLIVTIKITVLPIG